MIRSSDAQPPLLCLNLQQRHLDPTSPAFAPRAEEVLPRIKLCMGAARARGHAIVHVHTLDGALASPAIPGFEPQPGETVVLKRAASLFDHSELSWALGSIGCAAVVGFASSLDGLAAAIDADRWGVQLTFVRDAVSAARLPGEPPASVDRVLSAAIGQFARLISTADFVGPRPSAPMLAGGV